MMELALFFHEWMDEVIKIMRRKRSVRGERKGLMDGWMDGMTR